MFMNNSIGEKLYNHRKNAGFSQEELAEKIGVSRQAVSKWERDESSPDTNNLIALAKLYNISLDDLVLGETSSKQEEAPTNDKVDISPAGIQVESHTGDKDGVNVTENGHIVFPKKQIDSRAYRFFKRFPYPIITVIAYLLFGSLEILGGWGLGWLVFLTIPLYYTLIDAIARKNAGEFCYPVLVVMLYMYFGMVKEWWHPGWIMFLTIPVYYFLADFIGKLCKKNK